MINEQQDNTNGYVVLNKTIQIIESRFNFKTDRNNPYLSDRIVYLNSYLNNPEDKIPPYVFQSAYNLLSHELNVVTNNPHYMTPESEYMVLVDVARELERLSHESNQ